MDASEKYKSVFCDELFDKPERLIVVGASNFGKSLNFDVCPNIRFVRKLNIY